MLADLTWPPSTASTGNAVTYVLAHRGDHDAVLERLSTCSAVTTLGERTARPKYAEWWDMRRLYGFSEDHWSRQHGARRDVRVAVCLATDLIWLGYSDGLLAARNVVRLPLELDCRAFGATLHTWAIEDYPALAVALGAALTNLGGQAMPCIAFEAVLTELLLPHVVDDADSVAKEQVARAAKRCSQRIIAMLAASDDPPLTGPQVAGSILEVVGEEIPSLHVRQRIDPILDFERAAARLVSQALTDPGELPQVESALNQLARGVLI